MKTPHSRRFLRALLALVVPTPLLHAGVITVGPAPSDFTSITAAVASAQADDILLVRSGSYAAFTLDGKGLSVVADEGASVQVNGLVRIENLAPAQGVVLSGLTISGSSTSALSVLDVNGSVRVQHCVLRVAPDMSFAPVHAATVTNTRSAAFEDVVFQGGAPVQSFAQAGDGLRVDASHVALFGCSAFGGPGASGNFGQPAPGTSGGAGLTVVSGEAFVSDTQLHGGAGGRGGVQTTGSAGCAGQIALVGGAGGSGIVAGAGALVRARASTCSGATGGLGGTTSCGSHALDGGAGADTNGNVTVLVDAPRRLHAAPVAREGASLAVRVDGVPGDRVMLFFSGGPATTWRSSSQGVALVRPPFQRRIGMGVVPASGSVGLRLNVPELGAGVEGTAYHAQVWFIDASGAGHMGEASVMLALDRGI